MTYSQFGLTLSISAGVGIVTLAFLMLVHKQMQKSAQIAQLKAELAQSRQVPRARPVPRAPAAPPASATSPSVSSAKDRIRELSRDIGNLAANSEHGVGPASHDRSMQPGVRTPLPPMSDMGVKPGTDPLGATEGVPLAGEPGAAFAGPQGEPVREQWSFRPRTDAQASVQEATAAMVGSGQAPKPPVATVEGDLELVQRKIKELADEVNAAEALRPKPQLVAARPKGPPNMLEDSIGALRAAAKSMRGKPSLGDFVPKLEGQSFAPQPEPAPQANASPGGLQDLVIPATAERIAASDFSAPQPETAQRDVAPPSLELPLPDFGAASPPILPPRAAAIARAVEEDAMDVLLGPIVTLAEHSVSHYKMIVNLRGSSGELLAFDEDDFALIGEERDAHFDITRLNRAAALAARMEARDKEGSLLAEFLGSSMTSRAFLETFANVYEARQRISAQLVLTFSQRAVDEFTASAWQAVRDMHTFGFRFAMDKVRHMGTDFAALQRSGFRFVRMDARVLSEGLSTPERFVPADEILQRATLAGLTVVAAGIEDAATQKRLLDAGVPLGQGPLFGAPRQVNVDSRSGPSDHSAAA
jgi:cyclic-di-GMP phosphodiesterase TipF (flagellum assembly factor)